MHRPNASSIAKISLRKPTLWLAGAALVLFPLLSLAPAAAQDHTFVGVAKCRSCHKKESIGNQYGIWLDSKHAKAYEVLASDKAKKWGAEAGVADPQKDAKCVKCHVTAYGVPKERISRKFDPSDGVQCETCHGAGKDYRKKKVMQDRDLAISKGLVIPTEALCVECHNDESPAWDPERFTRADGTKTGFDFDAAVEKIRHPVPEGYGSDDDDDDHEDD